MSGAGRRECRVVNRKRVVGFREAREEPVLEHGGRALDALLGRLADVDERAVPAVFILDEQGGGAHAGRHVQIVPAGVHHRNFDALIVVGGGVAGVGEFGLFKHGQRIKFGADHHGGSGPVLEHTHYSGITNVGGDFETEFPELVGNLGGRLFLMQREFGSAMQVFVERAHRGVDGADLLCGRRAPRVGGEQGDG